MKKLILKQLMLALALLLSSFSVLQAQSNAKVYGGIHDQNTGEPISGAYVVITELNQGANSDNEGNFSIDGLKAGKYTLTVSHVSYDTEEVPITIADGESKLVDFYLTPAQHLLNEVIVKEKYVRDIPYIKHVLKKEDVELQSTRDIGDQLRMLPNVSGIKKGGINIDPVVRGFKSAQLNIQMDNAIRIEGGCPNRMDPTSSHISLDDMSEMQVLKGPFALRYGPTFGGVVNLVSVKPTPYEQFEIHVKGVKAFESNWNGNREYLAVNGGNDRIYFLFSGYQQKYGDYTAGNDITFRSAFHKFGYTGKIGIRPFKNHEILLTYSNSIGKGVRFAALPMDDRSDNSKIYSLDYKIGRINKVINSVDVKVYQSVVDHVMDNLDRPFGDTVAAIASINAIVQGARAEAGLTIFGGHLYAGVDYKKIDKDGDRVKNMILQYPNPMGVVPKRVEALWNEAMIQNMGFFAEYKKKIKTWEIIAAARLDMNKADAASVFLTHMMTGDTLQNYEDNSSNYVAFSFSAGLTKHLNEKASVNFALGRGTRFPDMNERFIISLPIGFDKFEYIGNPQLEPEVNNEADINFKYLDPVYGGVDFTIFASFVQNYIMGERIPLSEQRPLTQSVYGVKRFKNFDQAYFFGFEFAYKTPEKYKFGASVVAAYTRGTISETIKPIIDPDQPPLQAVTGQELIEMDPAPEIPPFDATAAIHYKMFSNKLIPQLSFRYVAAQNYVSAAYFEEETPAFGVANFNVAYMFSKTLTVSGGVNNIFDSAYYEHLNRRVIGSKAIFYEPGRVFYINMVVNI